MGEVTSIQRKSKRDALEEGDAINYFKAGQEKGPRRHIGGRSAVVDPPMLTVGFVWSRLK
jgi:hypothetical protein